jgi:hypothetical protein
MTDTATLLRRCGLFRGFDDQRLATLTPFAEEVTYEEHAVILREGDLGDAIIGPGRCPGSNFNMHEFFLVLDTFTDPLPIRTRSS